MTVRHASCSCGQLRVETKGEPVRVSVCHCLECQKRTGSAFGAQARWPKDQVTISGESRSWTRKGDDGGAVEFHFCPTCGSTVHYRLLTVPDIVAVALGAFADPNFPPPNFSVYEMRKHAWVGMPEDIEHHD